MKKILILGACLILLTGCFETDFKLKTTVKPDGSIVRETSIDGRGANRFTAPSGKGWEVKSFDTRSGQSILENTYHHVHAIGHFKNASELNSDYQFNSEKQFEHISDEERKNFIQLGIVEPFEENVYSKNFIQVVKQPGIFRSTFEYQEIFQNKGIIELLLNDIKKEVVREQSVALPSDKKVGDQAVRPSDAKPAEEPPAEVDPDSKKEAKPEVPKKASGSEKIPALTIEGQLLASKTVDSVAQEKLKTEVLSKFRFSSEVTLPGEIVSSNAGSIAGNTAVWQFSAADFDSHYMRYILRARSQMIEWKNIVLLFVLLLVIGFGLTFVQTKKQAPVRAGSKKR